MEKSEFNSSQRIHIVENLEDWNHNFQSNCLINFAETGKIDWNSYSYVKNKFPIQSSGIDPAKSKLLFISSAGGYLPIIDKPFDATNIMGDYSIRHIPINSESKDILYAHEHYDSEAVKQDLQVLLPLKHLQKFVAENVIGELCNNAVSFMGYQPDLNLVVSEMIPQILEIAKQEKATAALLVPS